MLTRDYTGEIALRAEMDNPGYTPPEYSIRLAPQGPGYTILEEYLNQATQGHLNPFKHIEARNGDVQFSDPDTHRLQKPDWDYEPLESALSQVPKMYRQSEELRRILSLATQYHVLDVRTRAPVKLPQQLRPALLPGQNGEDLAPFLYNLRETHHGKYEAIADSLRVSFPGPVVASGMISMTWKGQAFRIPFYINELSERTLRFLWLTFTLIIRVRLRQK